MNVQPTDTAIWLCALIALVVSWFTCQVYIMWMSRRAMGQAIRELGPESHQKKAGTPTGGGLCILLGLLAGCAAPLLMSGDLLNSLSIGEQVFDPKHSDVIAVLAVTLALGLVGALDDWLKISQKNNRGISGYVKLFFQILTGTGLGMYLVHTGTNTDITLLNWGRIHVPPWAYMTFCAWVVTAFSNAVNLTDGLDGLAASTVSMSLLALMIALLCFWSDGFIPMYPHLAFVCLVLLGACLGFLAHNQHPARLFMGDVGSLALGGALAAVGLIAHYDFWLVLFGLIFVVETLSVILQVGSFKLRKVRLFKMSPIHHHFELCGWHETTVVQVFTMVQVVAAGLAMWGVNHP